MCAGVDVYVSVFACVHVSFHTETTGVVSAYGEFPMEALQNPKQFDTKSYNLYIHLFIYPSISLPIYLSIYLSLCMCMCICGSSKLKVIWSCHCSQPTSLP